jgi:hypothetical protein
MHNLTFPLDQFHPADIYLGVSLELKKCQSKIGQLALWVQFGVEKMRGKINLMAEDGHKWEGQIHSIIMAQLPLTN